MNKFLKKRININHLILLISILFLWILFSFCSKVPDFENYALVFRRLSWGDSYHSMETGYWLLCKAAYAIGLDINGFRKIYGLVGLSLMASTAVRYTKKPYYVLSLYLLYPFLLDVVQIRHFMACSIIVFGIRYLEYFETKNFAKYCLCVCLAMSQHTIALAYSAFLFVYLKNLKTIMKIVIPTAAGFLFLGKMLMRSTLYRSLLDYRGIEDAYMDGIAIRQFLLYMVFFALLSFLCYYLWKIGKTKSFWTDALAEERTNAIFKICMISIVYIPLVLIDFQLTRLFRGCVFIMEVFIIRQLENIYALDRFLMKIIVFAIFLFVFVKLFGPTSVHYESLTIPVFWGNNFLDVLF